MNNQAVAVIDYGAGNLRSVLNAIAKLGYQTMVTNNPDDLFNAAAVILPGVGAAGDTMHSLEKLRISNVLLQLIDEKRPFFAVCVGLQVLFSGTEESGWHKCLDVIPGIVKRLPLGLKIPHMGWNQVKQMIAHPLFDGIPDEANFYFVHSYYSEPQDTSVIAGTTDYGKSICSVVIRDNLVATQFHPEKSGYYGLKLYSNFLERALSGR
ncbi:MAG: imidazole glycerol phosphate synthase subunit HisH [Dehalococcoidia bacterium]|nr:imidazole glycerol phosphate synthase subunit HisH [Dehalococcoidia bacterium]RLC65093.1 MAG: imidazole glycerol phosphate synthase subunit HisH [Chloroflexota bacterium]